MLLSARPAPRVIGYAAQLGKLYRFDEQAGGDYQLMSRACPMTPQLARQNWISRWPGTFSSVHFLPNPGPGAPAVVATVLFPRALAEPGGWMRSACKEIASLNGSLSPVDKQALLESLRQGDTPMHFPRLLEEVPGYIGVTLPDAMLPPSNGVRVDGVIGLDKIQATSQAARVERVPQIRVTGIPSLGAFAAAIPIVQTTPVAGPCWVQLRLKVLTGQVGIAAFDNRSRLVARSTASIIKSAEPMDVALRLSTLNNVTQVVIFNDLDIPFQVDVLDASLWTPRALPDRASALLPH